MLVLGEWLEQDYISMTEIQNVCGGFFSVEFLISLLCNLFQFPK